MSRLRRAPALKDMAEGRAVTQSLLSIYYDTPDHALRKAGIALRLRRKGRRWVQTVKKAGGPIAGGLSQPLEDERGVTGQKLVLDTIGPDDLREEVIGIARAGLAPVSETRFRRTAWRLRAPSGGLVELAIDVGEVCAGGVTAPLSEAELEVVRGHAGDLFAVAAALIRQGPVRHSNHSKSARAQMLAVEGFAIEPLAPLKAAPVTLAPSMTCEEAAGLVLGECLAHATAAIPVTVETDDPEGPHQLRVGLRRLRSALSAFRPALGREALAGLADRAREIGALAAPLRDWDVLAGEMIAPEVERHPDEPGFAALLSAIEARREAVRGPVRKALAGPEVTRFVFEAPGFVAGRGWLDPGDLGQTARLARPVEALARDRLDRRWKALAAYGRRIEALSIEERHEMRKEIKKLRYVAEVFRSLFDPDRFAAFRKALKSLQKDFGALNDAAMMTDYLTAPDAPAAADPAAQRAAGRLIGAAEAEAAHIWPRAVADWAALRKAGRFWR